MPATSAERVRAHRARRRRREVLLPIPVSDYELRKIALRGYEGAALTPRRRSPIPRTVPKPAARSR